MTHSRLNGSGIFTTALAGLTQGYAYAVQNAKNKSGITMDDILKSYSNTSSNLLTGITNTSFASFLSSNFSSFDMNGDGQISADEMQNYQAQIVQSGLTRAQLAQLGTQYGYSSEELEEVLNNFDKIDANHDGRVSQAEISAYGLNDEISDKKQEFAKHSLNVLNTFHSSVSASSDSSEDKTDNS